MWAFAILFTELNEIAIAAGQHVNNGLHSWERRISLFLYFPCIFWGNPPSLLLYLALRKTALPSFEEICKSYYLLAKGWQETGWTKSYAIVHIPDAFDFWIIRFFINVSNESKFFQNFQSLFSLSFHGSTIGLHLLTEFSLFLYSLVLAESHQKYWKIYFMFRLQSRNTLTIISCRALVLFELPGGTRHKNL